MKTIKVIVEDIREEMTGAEHYAKLATQYKDSDKPLADMYAALAQQELGHVDTLHVQAARIIKSAQAGGKEAPPAMQAVWDWEHTLMIDTVTKIKMLLDSYKK